MANGNILYQGEWSNLNEENPQFRGALLSVKGTNCTVTSYQTQAELSEAYKQLISDNSVSHYSVL